MVNSQYHTPWVSTTPPSTTDGKPAPSLCTVAVPSALCVISTSVDPDEPSILAKRKCSWCTYRRSTSSRWKCRTDRKPTASPSTVGADANGDDPKLIRTCAAESNVTTGMTASTPSPSGHTMQRADVSGPLRTKATRRASMSMYTPSTSPAAHGIVASPPPSGGSSAERCTRAPVWVQSAHEWASSPARTVPPRPAPKRSVATPTSTPPCCRIVSSK
mmetsp:Transcript_6722/g.19957  ORF Transcript_6722/g.19957 Transcript_6722/m.19957 type:complete len:217 (-) Transcript_6722:199-849(-)